MGFLVKAVKSVVKAVVGVVAKVAGAIFGFSTGKKTVAKAKSVTTLNKSLDPEAYKKIVLGAPAAPLDVRFWEVWGAAGANYDEVIAVAGHQINAVKETYFEDALAFDAAGNPQGKYIGVVSRAANLGTVGQAALAVGSGTQWTAQATFDGCPHIKFAWVPDEKKLPNGIPSRYTQVVEGALVYDPRRDSTVGGFGGHRANDRSTWSYATLDGNGVPIGRNNALQALWYLLGWTVPTKDASGTVTGSALVCGRGVDPQDINMATFIAGANACEAAGYYTDVVLSTEDTHTSNEDKITCDGLIGRLMDPGGLWSYYANVNDTANIAVDLTDADIIQGANVTWNEYKPMSEQYNQVSGKYINPSATTLYQAFPYPLVRDATYETNLGIKRRKPQDFEQVLDGNLAQRLARLLLNEGQYQGEFSAGFNYRALKAQAWSVVRYTSDRFGWTKLFRVYRYDLSTDSGIGLMLREIDPSIWSAGTVTPPVAPGVGNKYNPNMQVPVTGFAVAQYTAVGPGTNPSIADGARVTWDAPPINVRRTDVRYRIVGTTYWETVSPIQRDTATNVVIFPLVSGAQYEFQIRHITIHEIEGDWLAINPNFNAGTQGNVSYAGIVDASGKAIWNQITGSGKPENNANVTETHIADGFRNQGTIATQSVLPYGSSYLSGFNYLATLDRVRLGLQGSGGLVNTANTQWLTEPMLVTSQGISDGFRNQGLIATLSSLAYGSTYLTGFNALAALDRVKLGLSGGMVNEANNQWLTDANTITYLGISDGFRNQGSLSTLNNVTASYVNFKVGGGNVLRNSSFEIATAGDPNLAAGFGIYDNDGGVNAYSLVAGRSGGTAQRVSWVSNNTTKGVYLISNGNVNNTGLWLPNTIMIVSWYARASGAAIGNTMGTAWNYYPSGGIEPLLNPTLSANWQRYAFRLNWGATVDFNGFFTISGGASGSVDFDDMQIEVGEVPTGYAPAFAPGEVGYSYLKSNAVRLGSNITRADGVSSATEALLVTSLGIADGFRNQGLIATLSSLANGSAYLTGFGLLSQRNYVKIGGPSIGTDSFALLTSSGNATSEPQLITSQGISDGFKNQAWGATAAQSLLDNSYVATGKNLIPNSDGTYSINWVEAYHGPGVQVTLAAFASVTWGTDSYALPGRTRNVYVYQSNYAASGTATDYILYNENGTAINITCSAGERLYASYYGASHRCNFAIYISWLDNNGNVIGYSNVAEYSSTENNTNSLGLYTRASVPGVAPAGTYMARLVVRKQDTYSNQTNSYFWFAAPMLERASANQIAPSAYSPGPTGGTRELGFTGELAADVTYSHISDGYRNQTAWGTLSAPTSKINFLQSDGTMRLGAGQGLLREDAGAWLTNSYVITELGISDGFKNQTAWATYTVTTARLTYLTDAGRMTLGVNKGLTNEAQTFWLQDGDVVTNQGISDGFKNQTAWATYTASITRVSYIADSGRIVDPRMYNTQFILGPSSTSNLSPTYTNNTNDVTISFPAHTRYIAGPYGPIALNYGGMSTVWSYNNYWTAYVDDPDLTGIASPSLGITTNPNDLLLPGRYQLASGMTPANSGSGGTVGGGGGSGGGGFENCVAAESFMPDGRYAMHIKAGDDLKVLCERTWSCGVLSRVTANKLAEAECAEIMSKSGIRLIASVTTPCTLKGGAVLNILDVLGQELAVEDAEGFRWEEVVSVNHVGRRAVAHISADNGTYAAGAELGRYIYTHNIYYKP